LEIAAYLYDANGRDEEVRLEDVDVAKLEEDQLLWINVLQRDNEALKHVAEAVQLEDAPITPVTESEPYPRVENFEHFFRFSVNSVTIEVGKRPEKVPIEFIVGKNFVVTIHEGEIDHFAEFREREKGETHLGELDAESFLATLLDLQIVSYFKAIEEIERRVDEFDENVLKSEMETDAFLSMMVGLRRDVSKLRRWLMPHREVFYSLTRADFRQIAESDSAEEYRRLNEHFQRAVEAVEHARETVISVFELYATKSTHMTNTLVQRLTFLTLTTGTLAVIAGVLGMNFKADIFEVENGFWVTVAGLVVIATSLTIFARIKRWI
jgi:magnesium transporter